MKAVAQGVCAHSDRAGSSGLGTLAGELSRREVLRTRPAPPAAPNHLLNPFNIIVAQFTRVDAYVCYYFCFYFIYSLFF